MCMRVNLCTYACVHVRENLGACTCVQAKTYARARGCVNVKQTYACVCVKTDARVRARSGPTKAYVRMRVCARKVESQQRASDGIVPTSKTHNHM